MSDHRELWLETLITILTIENLNSWQSLVPDNWLWHWTAFAILAMFSLISQTIFISSEIQNWMWTEAKCNQNFNNTKDLNLNKISNHYNIHQKWTNNQKERRKDVVGTAFFIWKHLFHLHLRIMGSFILSQFGQLVNAPFFHLVLDASEVSE